ncbi:MAG: hypothetical protein OXF20_12460 [Gammaproteobacteria bacterium]|nr:hypothetical protein [Gammaproteobacteria bacterium]
MFCIWMSLVHRAIKEHMGEFLTRKVKGQSVLAHVTRRELEAAQQQVAEHQRFQHLVKKYIQVNESLCDRRMKSRQTERKTRQMERTLNASH